MPTEGRVENRRVRLGNDDAFLGKWMNGSAPGVAHLHAHLTGGMLTGPENHAQLEVKELQALAQSGHKYRQGRESEI